MTSTLRIFILTAAVLSLTACMFYWGGHGTKIQLNTEVHFVEEDQTPVRNAKVYVVENFSFEAPPLITEATTTGDAGIVFLKGAYCLPAEIGMDGGYLVIRPESIRPSYTVVVKKSRTPSLQTSYGFPKPDAAEFKQRAIRRDCR